MLTKKQKDIYDYIVRHKSIYGYTPTYREIGESFRITVKGAYDHVSALIKKDVIKKTNGKSRSIVVI